MSPAPARREAALRAEQEPDQERRQSHAQEVGGGRGAERGRHVAAGDRGEGDRGLDRRRQRAKQDHARPERRRQKSRKQRPRAKAQRRKQHSNWRCVSYSFIFLYSAQPPHGQHLKGETTYSRSSSISVHRQISSSATPPRHPQVLSPNTTDAFCPPCRLRLLARGRRTSSSQQFIACCPVSYSVLLLCRSAHSTYRSSRDKTLASGPDPKPAAIHSENPSRRSRPCPPPPGRSHPSRKPHPSFRIKSCSSQLFNTHDPVRCKRFLHCGFPAPDFALFSVSWCLVGTPPITATEHRFQTQRSTLSERRGSNPRPTAWKAVVLYH